MRHILLLVSLLMALPSVVFADEKEKEQENRAAAPKNHSIIRSGYGGAWYIPNELWNRYTELKLQAERLNNAIDRGEPDAASAIHEIDRLKNDLLALDSLIEDEKVFVSPMKIYEQTDTYEFDLSSTRAVIIVADDVQLESWDGAGIRCVMKKSVLGKDQPAPDEFAQILIEHELKVASELVGTTAEERAASHLEFLKSTDAQKMTEEQLKNRQAFVDEITGHYEKFAAYQGQPANVLSLQGLKGDEGNQHITVEVDSEGGTGSMSGHWKRRAEVVVFLPKQVKAAILGAQAGIQVKSFSGDLLLSNSQSRDRNYEGEFIIDGLDGTLSVYGVPVRSIRNIRGSVVVSNEDEMRNGGSQHQGGLRRMYVDTTLNTEIENVTKDVTGTWLHTRLNVSGVQGQLNIVNSFGATDVVMPAEITKGMHRVVSESGSIRIRTSKAALAVLPWYAHNQVGEIQVNVDRETLEDVHFSTSGQRWNGFYSPVDRSDHEARFTRFERPARVLQNSKRTPGFDVLSRAGRIVIEAVDE